MRAGKQKAVQQWGYGGIECLQIEQVNLPVPRDNEVLVQLLASGINPIDWKIRRGFRKVDLPFTPGVEGCGRIIETGNQVSKFGPGDIIYGAIDHSYAEYAIANSNFIFSKPANLSIYEAAAMGGGKTAWGALFEVANLQSGQSILVHGASGGVGVFAVQLAHLAGAEVIATASSCNHDLLRLLGADRVIDYHQKGYLNAIGQVDMILDMVGLNEISEIYPVVKKNGTFISIVKPVSQELAKQLGIRAFWGGTKTSEAMAAIDTLTRAGKLLPIVRRVFHGLEEAPAAQLYSEKGGDGAGKVVLSIANV